jgi:hypothetical protein
MKKAAKTFGDVDLDLAYAPECKGMPRAGAPTQGVAIETIPPISARLSQTAGSNERYSFALRKVTTKTVGVHAAFSS